MQDHPKDAEFLNCPIRFYTEMEAIFGHSMATGRFALGSGEPLGANQSDNVAATAEGTAFNKPSEGKTNIEVGEAARLLRFSPLLGCVGRERGGLSLKMSCSCSLTCQTQLTMLQMLLERLAQPMLMPICTLLLWRILAFLRRH